MIVVMVVSGAGFAIGMHVLVIMVVAAGLAFRGMFMPAARGFLVRMIVLAVLMVVTAASMAVVGMVVLVAHGFAELTTAGGSRTVPIAKLAA